MLIRKMSATFGRLQNQSLELRDGLNVIQAPNETGKSTWLLGLAGITEGAIPMAIEDPLRVIGSFVLGSMVTGAIVGAMNIGLSTPGAGIFSLFLLHDNGAGGVMAAIGWFGAALVGAAISTAILLIWRRHAVKHGNYLTDGVMP